MARFLVSALCVSVPLSGDEGWVLQCLEHWWFVVRKGRGGHLDPETGLPYTTVSAREASDWLLERRGVSLHLKACQRAFRSLASKGVVRRYQDWHRWGRHSYSYAPGENHPSPSVAPAAKPVEPCSTPVSNREDSPVPSTGRLCPPEGTPVSNQTVLSSSSTTESSTQEGGAVLTSSLEAEPASRVNGGRTASRGPCVPLSSVRSTAATLLRSVRTGSGEAPRGTPLAKVLARCFELAGLAAVPTCTPPSRVVSGDQVTELVKVNGCLHRVADPALTAFLR